MRDSCGISGTGETIQCRKATNGLTARPAESEHPETEINYFQKQQSMRKQPIYFVHVIFSDISIDMLAFMT
ncbi:hypothetical protein J2X07_001213 [Fictibacillus barbaricus]|uniref:Uncharacterized protein n=1 Tax=Fictibacillus barbaricus TaxID=182136 RepID=A0ABU1TYD8_9BACL|nr:hypothetical protein [Fictibacillus barbaricus]